MSAATAARKACPNEVFIRPDIAKTGISRSLPISRETVNSLNRLVAVNQKNWGTELFFFSCEGRPLCVDAWKKRMQAYSRKTGTVISPYDLRHAFAIMYLRNGGDAFTLQRMMGHTDMEMTKRYLKFSQADLQAAHAGASPLSTLLGQKKKVVKLT